MKRTIVRNLLNGGLIAAAATVGGQYLSAQRHGTEKPPIRGYFEPPKPWTGGGRADVAFQTSTGATIPMSTYTIVSTKDGGTYTGTLVGSNPFAKPATGTTIPVVVVPLKVTIGTQVFDPAAANACGTSTPVATQFMNSPLVVNTPLTFNGLSVGTTQYVNGFLRAEFWYYVRSAPAYQNTLNFTLAPEVSITASSSSQGTTSSSGCTEMGILSETWLSGQLNNQLSALTNSGVVGPTKFVIFLTKNVVQSTASTPSINNGCCILGYHTAQGSVIQTWGIMNWDTTGDFGSSYMDASTASHEIAEWMNDPLGNNATPAWGKIGQVSGCQDNLEVGDPLSGSAVAINNYHLQELGYFSWYFTKAGAASIGLGGTFSSNGTFTGPSKACPPGGTN